jgi:hypothetical protein
MNMDVQKIPMKEKPLDYTTNRLVNTYTSQTFVRPLPAALDALEYSLWHANPRSRQQDTKISGPARPGKLFWLLASGSQDKLAMATLWKARYIV